MAVIVDRYLNVMPAWLFLPTSESELIEKIVFVC